MGGGELLIILLVALIVFGPNKLPELAANLGKVLAKARTIKSQIDNHIEQQQLQLTLEENLKKAAQVEKDYEEKLMSSTSEESKPS